MTICYGCLLASAGIVSGALYFSDQSTLITGTTTHSFSHPGSAAG